VSSDALGTEVDLDAIVDRAFVGDVGIPAGAELLAFTNAVQTGEPDIGRARQELTDIVGHDGLIEAAATIAVFNGLVRVADGTGIPLDQGLQSFSQADRGRLGIDTFAGAANTTGPGVSTPVGSISELFG
jgi:hypothetical protein